jgi:hypothetical protein
MKSLLLIPYFIFKNLVIFFVHKSYKKERRNVKNASFKKKQASTLPLPYLPQFQNPVRSIRPATLQRRKEETLETFLLKKTSKYAPPLLFTSIPESGS